MTDETTPKTILVVEDDSNIRDLLVEILRDAGYRVASAHEGRSALSAMNSFPPDLILLDLVMPVMSGWATLEELRAQEHWAAIPIVLVAASLDLDQWATQLGAAGFIAKPFEVDRVLYEVQRCLGAG